MTEFPDTQSLLLANIQSLENREAWEEFVEVYRPIIYRMARRRGMQDSDAQDLSQDVLLRVSGSIDRWEPRPGVRFRHWLRTVAANAIVTALTKSNRAAMNGSSADQMLAAVPESETESELENEYLRERYLRAAANVKVDVSPHHLAGLRTNGHPRPLLRRSLTIDRQIDRRHLRGPKSHPQTTSIRNPTKRRNHAMSEPQPTAIDCDPKRVQAFLDSDHYDLEDSELIEHLDHCDTCRELVQAGAGDAQHWKQATELLKPTEFDHAGTPNFSAGTVSGTNAALPASAKEVLDSLAPSEHPDHLGRLGTYEITGVVGVGGMGVVLKAIDPSLDRIVAVKVMNPRLANNDNARKRFAREAKAAAAVIHPNVIPIHSVASNNTLPYLVMACVPRWLPAKASSGRRPTAVGRSSANRCPGRRRSGRRTRTRSGAPRHQTGKHPSRRGRRTSHDH